MLYERGKLFETFGYEEEGCITTPFDMRVINKIDRFHLVLKALEITNTDNKELVKYCNDTLKEHSEYIRTTGEDLDIVKNWKWKC